MHILHDEMVKQGSVFIIINGYLFFIESILLKVMVALQYVETEFMLT
jgi:hypothetical protein